MSISAQMTELKEYAAKERLEIVASFQEAKTAKEPGRTKFGEMLEMVENGHADCILTWHPDRLARNAVDGGKIMHLLDTGKLKHLCFPTMTFENSPQGKFMLSIAFGQSKYYVDNLSENVKRGIRAKLRRGEWPCLAPVGYLNNPKTRNIQSDLEKAPMIKQAFEWYATGEMTLYSLKEELHNLGLRSFRGKSLAVSSVQNFLQNPIYYGMIRCNGELFPGSFEPIITKDLFDKAQAIMNGRAKKRRKRKHNFPFIGFLHCAECGCAVTAERQKGHHYYRCTHKRGECSERKYQREENLLDQVKQIVEQISLPDDWADAMLEQLDREKVDVRTESRTEVQRLRNDKKEVETKLENLLDLRLEGVLGTDEYLAKKNKLTEQKYQIDQQIAHAEHGVADRLEPVRDLIIRSKEAKQLLSNGEPGEFPTFLRSVGSNFLLKGNAVRYEAQKGWRVVRQQQNFPDWSG